VAAPTASADWARIRTSIPIQEFVALPAAIQKASCSAIAQLAALAQIARAAGIASATPMSIQAYVAVAVVTRMASCSVKTATTAARAHVESVLLTLARASLIADLIPAGSARVTAIPLVVVFADVIPVPALAGVPLVESAAADPLIMARPACSNLRRAACPIADVVASADLAAAPEAAVLLLR
jgi:hypothetical protein